MSDDGYDDILNEEDPDDPVGNSDPDLDDLAGVDDFGIDVGDEEGVEELDADDEEKLDKTEGDEEVEDADDEGEDE